MTDLPFASRTLAEHLVRGAIGFTAMYAAFHFGAGHPLAAIGLIVLALICFRGCPTCWLAGLFGTTCRIRQRPPD